MRLLTTIFDGEQCCIDNIRILRLLSINGPRRLLLNMEKIPILHKYFMFYLYNLEVRLIDLRIAADARTILNAIAPLFMWQS